MAQDVWQLAPNVESMCVVESERKCFYTMLILQFLALNMFTFHKKIKASKIMIFQIGACAITGCKNNKRADQNEKVLWLF